MEMAVRAPQKPYLLTHGAEPVASRYTDYATLAKCSLSKINAVSKKKKLWRNTKHILYSIHFSRKS
jgi:hypothetical protein